MRRFIRYLYEYEQEKKMRNVGFVKVEQDVDQCVIHVHGKGFRMEENAQGLRAYLFWNTEDKCIGIPQGVTEVPGPAVNWQLCYTPEDVGKKENYNLVNGIILKDVNGHWYAAVWNDDVVNVCRMEMWKMEEDSVQGEENECKKGLAQGEETECKKELAQDEESECRRKPCRMKNQRVENLKMIWKKRPAWGVKSARSSVKIWCVFRGVNGDMQIIVF